MKIIYLLPFLVLSCGQKTVSRKPVPAPKAPAVKLAQKEKPSVYEMLRDYLLSYEVAPDTTIENEDWSLEECTADKTEVYPGRHSVRWEKNDDGVWIVINGDRFSLANMVTINEVSDHCRDSLKHVSAWKEIRLYRLGAREIIALTLGYGPCTGTSCSVDYYVLYDVKTRGKSVFGTYRNGYGLRMYDFARDHRPDFIGTSAVQHEDGYGSTIYELYSLRADGRFRLSVSEGSAYFINHERIGRGKTFDEYINHHWIEALPALPARFNKRKRLPETPRFREYETEMYTGPLADPVFKGNPFADDREYVDFIRAGCHRLGINFGGRYTLIQRSCGTGCSHVYMVDRVTGHVFTHIRPHDGRYGYLYQKNSTLLWANSELFGAGEDDYYADSLCRPEFYRWSGRNFTRIRL